METYVELFEGGVGDLLVITIDLPWLIVARQSAEDVLQALELGLGRGGGKGEEEDGSFHDFAAELSLSISVQPALYRVPLVCEAPAS